MNVESRRRQLEKNAAKKNQRFNERHEKKKEQREKRAKRKAVLEARRQRESQESELQAHAKEAHERTTIRDNSPAKKSAPSTGGILQKIRNKLPF